MASAGTAPTPVSVDSWPSVFVVNWPSLRGPDVVFLGSARGPRRVGCIRPVGGCFRPLTAGQRFLSIGSPFIVRGVLYIFAPRLFARGADPFRGSSSFYQRVLAVLIEHLPVPVGCLHNRIRHPRANTHRLSDSIRPLLSDPLLLESYY